MGPLIGATGLVLGFALVWHIWWMAIGALIAVLAIVILRGFSRATTRFVPAEVVERDNCRWLDAVAAAIAITRADEGRSVNAGLAILEPSGAAP
jgi:cytochrome o ubiquinol oxidase subunit 1